MGWDRKKSVLISINPRWCELIASGKKTIEVRKTRPKIETPFKVYIYETKDPHYENRGCCWEKGKCFENAIGKVIGEFTCSSIKSFSLPYPAYFDFMGYCVSRILVDAKLTKSQAYRYLKDNTGYAWRISDLKIYDNPRELREFIKQCPYNGNCQQCEFYSEYSGECRNIVTRPTQSWMYVEEGICP